MSETHKRHTQRPSLVISFEGIEGVGKSTQVQLLAQTLLERGLSCIRTREPGGTSFGNQIRSCLLQEHDNAILPQSELCLLLASRIDHWQHLVLPALEKGQIVIIDRFIDATVAYQGYGRQLGADFIEKIHRDLDLWHEPDMTFLLDMPIEHSRKRLEIRGFSDRIEKEQDTFFHSVRSGYLEQAKKYDRIKVIDAQLSREHITASILDHMAHFPSIAQHL